MIQLTKDRRRNNFFVHILNVCYITAVLLCCSYTLLHASTNISADNLEYIKEEKKYIATGNVKIQKDDSVLSADKVELYEETSNAEATGNVIYEDPKTIINAERAEINIDNKTGKLYNALIFFRDGNYWINSSNIHKISENHYYANEATFTTCNPEDPKSKSLQKTDWCFKGRDVDVVVGERMRAKDVTYRIKGLPVIYSPYIWAPVQTERQTGFLMPVIGTSSKKGFQFSPSFFWAIDENKDATFSLDIFTRKGIGKSLEYRYIDFNGKGNFYAYHIRDSELKKDFFELKAYNDYQGEIIKSFLDINYVNHDEFFKEYSPQRDIRISRFLQSSAEVSLSGERGRVYVLGQYWIDLHAEDEAIPQRLPEIGYVINPSGIKPFLFSINSTITNFYREKGERGQRLDINPEISYVFGDTIRLVQSLSLRETAYNLSYSGNFDSFLNRETFNYKAKLFTRLLKRYDTFTHILEPSLSYSYIPKTKDLPFFDPVELFNKQSVAELSLYNQFDLTMVSVYLRITQPYNLNPAESSHHLMPSRIEASILGPFSLRADMSYDLNKNRTEALNSQLDIQVYKGINLSIGQRYDRPNKILFYRTAIDAILSDRLAVATSFWYDAKGGGLRDSTLRVRYSEQCWATNFIISRKPGDETRPVEYNFVLLIELKGIGTFKAL